MAEAQRYQGLSLCDGTKHVRSRMLGCRDASAPAGLGSPAASRYLGSEVDSEDEGWGRNPAGRGGGGGGGGGARRALQPQLDAQYLLQHQQRQQLAAAQPLGGGAPGSPRANLAASEESLSPLRAAMARRQPSLSGPEQQERQQQFVQQLQQQMRAGAAGAGSGAAAAAAAAGAVGHGPSRFAPRQGSGALR